MHANGSTEEPNVEGMFGYRIVAALLQHDAACDSKQPRVPDLVTCKVVADPQNLLWVADMTYVATRVGATRTPDSINERVQSLTVGARRPDVKKRLLCKGAMPDASGPSTLALVRMELSTASPLRCRHHASAGAAIPGQAGVVTFERIPRLT